MTDAKSTVDAAFHIIGADGKEYGPIPGETLRQWIAQGRAGATTRIRTVSSTDWVELKTLPEFAGEFSKASPAGGSPGRMPPIVAALAWTMFAMTAFGGLLMLVNLISLLNIPSEANFHPGAGFYIQWAMALLSLPAMVVAGIGLLRGSEAARRFAIGLACVGALFDVWGLAGMVQSWIANPRMFPSVLMSPMYVISTLWNIGVLMFNCAAVLILLRSDVRNAFAARNSSPAV